MRLWVRKFSVASVRCQSQKNSSRKTRRRNLHFFYLNRDSGIRERFEAKLQFGARVTVACLLFQVMEHRSFVLIQLCKLRTRSVRVGLSSSSIAKTRPFQKTHRSCRCTKKTKSTILCGAEERTATARREELKQKEKREEEDSRVTKTFLAKETSED